MSEEHYDQIGRSINWILSCDTADSLYFRFCAAWLSRAYFAHRQEFLPSASFYLPGPSSFIWPTESSPYFLTELVRVNAVSRVVPR